MTGGILQLVARGYDDAYIIKEPEITYFKIVYRRHTNFSMYPKILNFNQDIDFGKTGRCRIKFLGDLLHKVYLAIKIPEIEINRMIKIEKYNVTNINNIYDTRYYGFTELNNLLVDFNINFSSEEQAEISNVCTTISSIPDDSTLNINEITSFINKGLRSTTLKYLKNKILKKTYELYQSFITLYKKIKKTQTDYINLDNDLKMLLKIAFLKNQNYYCKLLYNYNLFIETYKKIVKTSEDVTLINTYLTQIYNYAFSTGNYCDSWYFPNVNDIFEQNFKNNDITKIIFEVFNTGKKQFAWVKELAHNLIENIEVNIDGVTIDTHNSEIIRSYNIINFDENKEEAYYKMIGNVPELYTVNSDIKPERILYLPLNFWFCKHISTAIPLVAMPHTFVDISVKFRKFDDVSFYENYIFNKQPKLDAYLIGHYVYVEEDERKRLCDNKLEYLIEKYESNTEEIIGIDQLKESNEYIEISNFNNDKLLVKSYMFDYKIDFNYCTKQIFWILKPYKNYDNLDKFNWNFYDNCNQQFYPLTTLKIKFNGRDREVPQNWRSYNLWNPYKGLCSSLIDNLYLYNLCLYPQMLQPSGSANFNKISDASIRMNISNTLYEMCEKNKYRFKVSAYALQYNILRVFSGMAGLAFVN